jgi:regulation of enolase protein 1 (concanavalin A-like superfamily)
MIRHRNYLNLFLAVALLVSGLVAASQSVHGKLGIFAKSTDVGKTLPGSTVFDRASGSYRVTGGGADMWGSEDAFHFSWVKLSGDATLTADVQFPADVSVPLEKGVLIFRQSLDPASAYADIAIHGDGHATIQWRTVAGGKTEDAVAPLHGPARLRIERKGNLFTTSVGPAGGPLTAFSSTTVAMDGPVYVGIGFCSHNAAGLASVTFSNVSIEKPER